MSAQDEMDRQEFDRMVEEDLPFGPELAQRILAIAGDDRILGAPARDLPSSLEALYKLTRLDDQEWSWVEPRLACHMQPSDISQIIRESRSRVRTP